MKNYLYPRLISSNYLNKNNTPLTRTSYGERISSFWELELILEGSGEIITNGEPIKTVPGRLFIRKPGMILEGISPYFSYFITFEDKENNLDKLPNYYDNMTFLSEYFNNIRNNYIYDDNINQLLVQSNLCLLLSEILKYSHHYVPCEIAKSIQYIKSHLEEKLTISQLAKISGYSINHYTRLFKDATTHTPANYIIISRIQKACVLLEETNNTVDAISQLCGFSNLSYFFRIFKQIKGVTPHEYRKNKRLYIHI